jgi:hypothetical protein
MRFFIGFIMGQFDTATERNLKLRPDHPIRNGHARAR